MCWSSTFVLLYSFCIMTHSRNCTFVILIKLTLHCCCFIYLFFCHINLWKVCVILPVFSGCGVIFSRLFLMCSVLIVSLSSSPWTKLICVTKVTGCVRFACVFKTVSVLTTALQNHRHFSAFVRPMFHTTAVSHLEIFTSHTIFWEEIIWDMKWNNGKMCISTFRKMCVFKNTVAIRL